MNADFDDGLSEWQTDIWPRFYAACSGTTDDEPTAGVFNTAEYDAEFGGAQTQMAQTQLYRPPPQYRPPRLRRKSRILAGGLQLLLPGVGRLYLGNDEALAHRLLASWGVGSLLCLSIVGVHLGVPLLVYAHVASLVDGLLILVAGVDYRGVDA